MALTVDDFREHSPSLPDSDAYLGRLLAAATAHIERLLGFKLDDADEFPNGTPADLELAVLQLAADWCENREASLIGITGRPIPFGVQEIVNEYRNWTFGATDNG